MVMQRVVAGGRGRGPPRHAVTNDKPVGNRSVEATTKGIDRNSGGERASAAWPVGSRRANAKRIRCCLNLLLVVYLAAELCTCITGAAVGTV